VVLQALTCCVVVLAMSFTESAQSRPGQTSAAQVFVSPAGVDENPCTFAAPCASFDRAYRAARLGQTIEIAQGTYGSQTIGVDGSKLNASPSCTPATPTRCIVFRPAAGAVVTLDGDLTMYGSNALFQGTGNPSSFRVHNLLSEAIPGPATSHNVIFENLDGAAFQIGPNHHIFVKGGDWGPNYICGDRTGTIENKIAPSGQIVNQWPHDIVLDGVYIHDQNSHDLAACHMGGLFLVSGYNLVLRNSLFSRNVTYDVLVQDFSNPECCGMKFGQPRNVVIQNNWFGPPVNGLADPGGDTRNNEQPELQFDERFGGWSNWLIRFNSFHNGFDFAAAGGTPTFANVRVVGNVSEHPRCFTGSPGLTWSYNAFKTGRCSRLDAPLLRLPYVSAAVGSENYHLVARSRAQNLVRAKTKDFALMTDIDGQKRPRGIGRDAGSDER
jgi:hypothetical protein